MKVKTLPLAAIVLAAFTFGIAGASVLGYWITESKKEPAKLASGEFAGQSDPADIRGSYTFGDIEKAFGVPASVLAEAFGFSDRPAADVKAKDLETEYAGKTGALEVGTDAIRFFVAAWLGYPYEPEADTGLPARAAGLLEARSLHPATAALVRSRIVADDSGFGTISAAAPAPVQGAVPASGSVATTPAASAEAPSSAEPVKPVSAAAESAAPAATKPTAPAAAPAVAAREVKGSTTFGDLYGWGLSQAQIRDALGGREPGGATEKVRDFCVAAGVEFSGVRAKLQALADALPKP